MIGGESVLAREFVPLMENVRRPVPAGSVVGIVVVPLSVEEAVANAVSLYASKWRFLPGRRYDEKFQQVGCFNFKRFPQFAGRPTITPQTLARQLSDSNRQIGK